MYGRPSPKGRLHTRMLVSPLRLRNAHRLPLNGKTRQACRFRQFSSAVADAQPSHWSPRRSTGSTVSSSEQSWLQRQQPPSKERSANCALTRWRCCHSAATTTATTSPTGSAWEPKQTQATCQRSSLSTGSAEMKMEGSSGQDSVRTLAS